MRIMDVDARNMTSTHSEDAPHPGRESVLVSLKGSFHGRTDRPAQASDSCQTACVTAVGVPQAVRGMCVCHG